MRPVYIIWIDSTGAVPSEMLDWCIENVGKPYPIVERPAEGVPYGADYDDPEGKWICHAHNHVGDGRYVDTFCFRDEADATMFGLKWA
jgi:hypothetical protein